MRPCTLGMIGLWRACWARRGLWAMATAACFVLTPMLRPPLGRGQSSTSLQASAFPYEKTACWTNPQHQWSGAVAPTCHPPAMLADEAASLSRTIAAQYSSMFGIGDTPTADDLKALEAALHSARAECLYENPFPAMLTRNHPPYHVCNRMLLAPDGTSIYLPTDTSESTVDADCLPLLMELVLPKGEAGVAVDVGASSGNTAFPLLASGHTVHLFEEDLDSESVDNAFVQMTVEVNAGWSNRTHLHGLARPSGPGSIDQTLAHVDRLHLLKIDVDDLESENAVFNGATEILQRTDVVEIEMIEVGVAGVWSRQRLMDAAGYDLYAVHGFLAGPSGQLVEHAAYCDGRAALLWRFGWHSQEIANRRGETVVEYNAYTVTTLQLEPMCTQCERGCRELTLASDCRQYVFVRRGTPTSERIRSKFGQCPAPL